MINLNFYNPTKIIFGRGELSEFGQQRLLGKECAAIFEKAYR